jgi:excisionase family DNA binding protein
MIVSIDGTNLLTVGQVASLLHIHPNTVRRWSNTGILKSYRICDRGDRRFKKEDVNLLLFESWLFNYDKESVDHKNSLLSHA